MQKNNQADRSDLIVVDAQSKAAEQIEKERKKKRKGFYRRLVSFCRIN